MLLCFRSIVFPLLEYCSPVWMFAEDSKLNRLNTICLECSLFLFPSGGNYDLDHYRKMSSLIP